MPWVESHTVILRHRKLLELARELRLRPVYVMGHLHALWHVALEQQEDGDLSSWSDEFIAESSAYPGDAPHYVSLLQKYRWLDNHLIHDWLDYAGLYLTKKYSTSNRELLVKMWRKHGREYGVNGKRTESEPTYLPTVPTVPNQPTNQGGKNSLPPDCAERIKGIHEWYSEQMGGDVRLGACEERLWFEWIKAGFEDDDLKRVVKFIRDGINEGERNRGAMKLSNLLQLERFSEDLLISKQGFPARVNGKTPEKSLLEKDMERNLEQVKRDFGKP